MGLPRDKLGTLALQWCAFAYVYAIVWLMVISLRAQIESIPGIGDSAYNILGKLFLVLAPAVGAAAIGLGLFAPIHALFTRGSARQALFGLLAAILSAAGAMGTWWLIFGWQ